MSEQARESEQVIESVNFFDTPGTTPKATIEEHVEDLLSIKAITPKAWACGARPPVPTHTRTLLVPVPIICCPLVTITQTAEVLGDSCSNKLKSLYVSLSFRRRRHSDS